MPATRIWPSSRGSVFRAEGSAAEPLLLALPSKHRTVFGRHPEERLWRRRISLRCQQARPPTVTSPAPAASYAVRASVTSKHNRSREAPLSSIAITLSSKIRAGAFLEPRPERRRIAPSRAIQTRSRKPRPSCVSPPSAFPNETSHPRPHTSPDADDSSLQTPKSSPHAPA